MSNQIRQGDVLLYRVAALPKDVTEVPPEGTRIVLAHGEVTGHAHAIYDHVQVGPGAAAEIAEAAIARAKARMWQTPSGERFLEVAEPVTLRHEEHTAHTLAPGIYALPVQVEFTAADAVRRVAD